ncbi:MAG: hypothetical protein V7L05_19665 [Nostoc sp.]
MPTKYVSKNIGEIAHNASSATGEVSAFRCDAIADISTSEND